MGHAPRPAHQHRENTLNMSGKDKKYHPQTQVTHGGRRKEWTHGIVNPPVYRASTCLFENMAERAERSKNPSAHHLFYGRKGTPTQWALAEALSELEGGEGCVLYPSGIAAVTGAILSVVKAGDHILITDSAYDPTRSFANSMLKDMNIEVTYYDPLIGAGIQDLIKDNTTAVLLESPGSLTFEVQDIPAIAEAAHDVGACVLLDNTWATPLLIDAFALGVDISIHAATKYIVGHSDVMIGAAIANKKYFRRLQRRAHTMGQTVSPDDAYLTLRGLRTLDVRLRQHEASALTIAKWLEGHDEVATILHPAFESCPGHEIWKRDFKGSSGLFSFVLKRGEYDDTAHFVDDLALFGMGFSWGGFESLALPSEPAHSRSAVKWEAEGPLVRLHIGLENTDDLITDLKAGLDRYGAWLDSKGA